jgi:hypothetical protein
MADTILNASHFDLGLVSYGTKKVNDRGGWNMNIMNKSIRSGLRLSTPMMLTWGASDYTDPDTGESDGKYSMALQFPEEEYSNPECEAFLENMVALDQKIKDDALAKSKDWFGKDHKVPEVIDALYSPMLKYPHIKGTKEPDYSRKPTLKLKIPCWKDAFNVEVYDEESQALFPNSETNPATCKDQIKTYLARTNVMCIIQCGGVWYANGKFGVTWKLMQAVIQKPREIVQGKCLINLGASDKAKFAAQPAADAENEDAGNDNVGMEVVPDSENEDEDSVAPEEAAAPAEEVVAPEPVPVPDPVPVAAEKKVVRRTRTTKA